MLFRSDDDYERGNSWERCGGIGNHAVDSDDADAWYDIALGPPNNAS